MSLYQHILSAQFRQLVCIFVTTWVQGCKRKRTRNHVPRCLVSCDSLMPINAQVFWKGIELLRDSTFYKSLQYKLIEYLKINQQVFGFPISNASIILRPRQRGLGSSPGLRRLHRRLDERGACSQGEGGAAESPADSQFSGSAVAMFSLLSFIPFTFFSFLSLWLSYTLKHQYS